MGDELVVGVTKDAHVGKPGRPIIPENERLELIKGIRDVTEARLVKDSIEALQTWEPDVFVKGFDYRKKGLLDSEIAFCKEHDIEIRFTKETPQTTTKIIERIKCAS
jgi:bifunctional ADP-heptose synthase (sugar kinase/adenylyltransferase)